MAKMFYTLSEAMKILKRGEDDIKQFAREGRLREFRDGPRLMFKADQVDLLRDEINVPDSDGFEAVIAELAGPTQDKSQIPLHNPYENEKTSPYWDVVKNSLKELEDNQDIKITTLHYYVIGYLVKQLDKADQTPKHAPKKV